MRGKRLKISLLPGACDWWEMEISCHVTLRVKSEGDPDLGQSGEGMLRCEDVGGRSSCLDGQVVLKR